MKKQLLYFYFLVLSTISFSQSNRQVLSGKIIDNLGIVIDANIINKNTNQGTFSNENGEFTLFAKINDSIHISSVGYETLKFKVDANHFGMNKNKFKLTKITITLNEVEVNSNNLTGVLENDSKQTPKDSRAEALAKVMDFSNIDMKAPVADDHIDKRVRPQVVNSDPNAAFVGAGASVGIPFKYSEKLWALRKELAFKKGFPQKLLNELGEKFFFEELQIPLENYYHFLEYCNPLGIEKLYQQGKTLEVIKILKNENATYLEIIKN